MAPTKPISVAESFDYVVVGAGSAGCVVASRLTEDPSVRVLLLEAGPEDSVDAIRVPALFSTLFGTGVDWGYRIEPQAHYGGSELYPRGKTLGGSSAINLMVYIRGDRADFDGWSQQGCAGWDYDSVLPYFMKSETNSRHKAPLHGTDGPLHVEDRMFTHELSQRWIDTAVEWGLPRTDDRPNLTVAVNSQASRILFDGGRATGVAYMRDGVEVHVRADAEVIVSGGAINSPQLLLLSGIGPAEQLRSQGIPVQVNLPGVGANLQDHVMTPIVWATKDSSDLLQLASPENLAVWQERRGGPFTSNGSEVGGFFSINGDTSPDVQFMGGPTSFVHHGRFSPPMPNFTMLAARTHPASRGKLWLQSADPLAPPHIDPAYFSDPEDLRYAKEGLRALLDIGAQQPFAANIQALNLPDRMPDDAALTEHIRRWSQTEYHTVGTCAMGTHENSVVDPLLRVRGVDNLRVIDASVMPTVISGNTNAAAIMIAEKGADLIKGHAQLVMGVRARTAETAAQ